MSSKEAKSDSKKAPDKEPSALSIETRDHGYFEFETKAGLEAAKKILAKGDRTVAWAHRTGGNQVRFLTWPDGQEQFVTDV